MISTPDILLILFMLIFVVLALHFHKDNSSFDLRHAYCDTKTGKFSIAKVGQVVALIMSSWAFAKLVETDKLSEWFFTAYMGIWVLAYLGKGVSNKMRNKAEETEGK
jgi:cation transport ATPase